MLSAYSIVLYALNNGDGTYNSTFEPNTDGYVKLLLESMIDDVKAVEHDFYAPNEISSAIYYLYKNLYALNGQLVTYEKVSKADAKEIERNVMDAIEQHYNARNVVFGEQIDYSDLIDVIQNADSRIKAVTIDIPKFQIHHVAPQGTISNDTYADSENSDLDTNLVNNEATGTQGISYATPSWDEKLTLVAKMILAGNVQLFKFDDDFAYDFGMIDFQNLNRSNEIPVGEGYALSKITTESNIEITKEKDYIVKSNEVIQLYAPSYVTKKEYSTFVRYALYTKEDLYHRSQDKVRSTTKDYYQLVDGQYKLIGKEDQIETYTQDNAPDPKSIYVGCLACYEPGLQILANENFPLSTTTYLKVVYTDSNNIRHEEIENSGIMCSSINMLTQPSEAATNNDSNLSILNSGQTIQIKGLNQTSLPAQTKVYWILNNSQNLLKLSEKTDESEAIVKVLQDGEYFIYTDSTSSELVILGSGTQLSGQIDEICPLIDLKDIENGDYSSIKWKSLNNPITITELEIITLGEGAKIKLTSSSTLDTLTLGNDPQPLKDPESSKDCEVVVTDSSQTSTKYSTYVTPDGQRDYYTIVSRLSLNVAAGLYQKLEDGQIITLTYSNNPYNEEEKQGTTNTQNIEVKEGSYIGFNNSILTSGGKEIDAIVYDETGNGEYSLIAYSFKVDPDFNKNDLYVRNKGVIKLSGETKESYKLSFTFTHEANNDKAS
ncbi:hypothetical protein [uncultured Clostridium sp.]|uniref:hypothetical protein n=1 Tax=uncultured Clostridium sp. TaxID=59620 RepID=UPI002625730A|nr:hypothetical protein [uncultured Clostridium sp.]